MEKAVWVARDDLSSIRTGRANPGMFARVNVDYYGSSTPITQLSSINVPEARLVVIKAYEANQLKHIEDAIRNSDLGVNTTQDGTPPQQPHHTNNKPPRPPLPCSPPPPRAPRGGARRAPRQAGQGQGR